MEPIAARKLPTVEQVETIIRDWGRCSLEDFARRFDLELEVVAAAVGYLRQMQRLSDPASMPAVVCYRDDRLESIVRCAGARHGYL